MDREHCMRTYNHLRYCLLNAQVAVEIRYIALASPDRPQFPNNPSPKLC